MKLCFSTGGWPFSLQDSMRLAQEMRYDGLEITAKSLNNHVLHFETGIF